MAQTFPSSFLYLTIDLGGNFSKGKSQKQVILDMAIVQTVNLFFYLNVMDRELEEPRQTHDFGLDTLTIES